MKITVFSTTDCAFCGQLKRFLDYKKLDYSSVNIDDDQDARTTLFNLSGASTVPQTIIERDGQEPKVVVGYNIGQLMSALV